MANPIVSSNRQAGAITMPDNAAMNAIFEIATKTADYLKERYEKKLINGGMRKDYQGVLHVLEEFEKNMSLLSTTDEDIWSGYAAVRPFFQNYHYNLAMEAAKELKSELEANIKFDFAINKKAEMLRAFSAEGKSISTKATENMDKIFSSWLVENNMILQDGVIYEIDEAGNIKKEGETPVRADAERVNRMMSERGSKGLITYLANLAIKISVQSHATPEEKPQPVKAAPAVSSKPATEPHKVSEKVTEAEPKGPAPT
jgi:hypothetical protein